MSSHCMCVVVVVVVTACIRHADIELTASVEVHVGLQGDKVTDEQTNGTDRQTHTP